MFRKVKKLSIRTEFRGSKIFTYQLRKKNATKEGKQVEKICMHCLKIALSTFSIRSNEV